MVLNVIRDTLRFIRDVEIGGGVGGGGCGTEVDDYEVMFNVLRCQLTY